MFTAAEAASNGARDVGQQQQQQQQQPRKRVFLLSGLQQQVTLHYITLENYL